MMFSQLLLIGFWFHPVESVAQTPAAEDFVTVAVSAVGFDPGVRQPIVLLQDSVSRKVLPIWIGPSEAQAIALALHGVVPPRPMTHDLMATLVKELGGTVEEVRVHDLRESTFYAEVRLRTAVHDDVRSIDSRPSDGLALALRTEAPVRVARKLLDAAPPFEFVPPDPSGGIALMNRGSF